MDVLTELLHSGRLFVWAGVGSALFSCFAFLPYVRDTIARRTRPQRASWLIWGVLGSISFFSQLFEGASSSLWFAAVQVGFTILIFALSIRFGTGKFLSGTDYLVLMVASLGLVVWYYTETAVYTLAVTIAISLLGGLVTAAKAYKEPDSETLSTWLISALASLMGVLSVGSVDWILMAYPLYLLTLSCGLASAILLGRMRRDAGNFEMYPQLGLRG